MVPVQEIIQGEEGKKYKANELAQLVPVEKTVLDRFLKKFGYAEGATIEEFKGLLVKTGISYADSKWYRTMSKDAETIMEIMSKRGQGSEEAAEARFVSQKIEGAMVMAVAAKEAGLDEGEVGRLMSNNLLRTRELEVFKGRHKELQGLTLAEYVGKCCLSLDVVGDRFEGRNVEGLLDDYIGAIAGMMKGAATAEDAVGRAQFRSNEKFEALTVALAMESGAVMHSPEGYRYAGTLQKNADDLEGGMKRMAQEIVARARAAGDEGFAEKLEKSLNDPNEISDFRRFFAYTSLSTNFLQTNGFDIKDYLVDVSMGGYLLASAGAYAAKGKGGREIVNKTLSIRGAYTNQLVTLAGKDQAAYKKIEGEFLKDVLSKDAGNIDARLKQLSERVLGEYGRVLGYNAAAEKNLLRFYMPGILERYRDRKGELGQALDKGLAYFNFNQGDLEGIMAGDYGKLSAKFAQSDFYRALSSKGYAPDAETVLRVAIDCIGTAASTYLIHKDGGKKVLDSALAAVPGEKALMKGFEGDRSAEKETLMRRLWQSVIQNVALKSQEAGSEVQRTKEEYRAVVSGKAELVISDATKNAVNGLFGFYPKPVGEHGFSKEDRERMLASELGREISAKIPNHSDALRVIGRLSYDAAILVEAGATAEAVKKEVMEALGGLKPGATHKEAYRPIRERMERMMITAPPERIVSEKIVSEEDTRTIEKIENIREPEVRAKRRKGEPSPYKGREVKMGREEIFKEYNVIYDAVKRHVAAGNAYWKKEELELLKVKGGKGEGKLDPADRGIKTEEVVRASQRWHYYVLGTKAADKIPAMNREMADAYRDGKLAQFRKSGKMELVVIDGKELAIGKYEKGKYVSTYLDGKYGIETYTGIMEALKRPVTKKTATERPAAVPVPVLRPAPKLTNEDFSVEIRAVPIEKVGRPLNDFQVVTVVPALAGANVTLFSKELKRTVISVPTTTFNLTTDSVAYRIDNAKELNDFFGALKDPAYADGKRGDNMYDRNTLADNLVKFTQSALFNMDSDVVNAAKLNGGTVYAYWDGGSNLQVTSTAPTSGFAIKYTLNPDGTFTMESTLNGVNHPLGSGTYHYDEKTQTTIFEMTTLYGPIYFAIGNLANAHLGYGVNARLGLTAEAMVPYDPKTGLPKGTKVKQWNFYPNVTIDRPTDLGAGVIMDPSLTVMPAINGGKTFFMPGLSLSKRFGGEDVEATVTGIVAGDTSRDPSSKSFLPILDGSVKFFDTVTLGGSVGTGVWGARFLVDGYGLGVTHAGGLYIPTVYFDGQDVVGGLVKKGGTAVYKKVLGIDAQ